MDFQRTNQQIGAGLTRYRSAPSSYFSSYLDAAADTIISGGGGSSFGGDDLDDFLNKFMPNNRINNAQAQDSNSNNNSFANSTIMQQSQSQFVVASMKQEPDIMQQPQQLQQQGSRNDYSEVSQQHVMYQSQAPAHQAKPPQNPNNTQVPNASAVDNSYRLLAPMKMGNGGGNSNLIRYNSSPAGLFANIDIENEYGAMRGIGNFGAGNNANAGASFSTANSFKGQMDFSSAQASSSGLMPTISEIGNTGMGEHNPAGDTNLVEGHSNDSGYMTGFPVASWDDSTILSDSFLKGLGDDHEDNKNLSNVVASENQNNKGLNRPPTLLSHHLSLPKTSDEFSAIDTLMQDSVLCKLRAKRGCATHPRSIAERVRRTRISERMRKLQELVPNMDKQTNTADMLDLAVDYIRDLQKQVQSLSDNRAKCTCLNQ